MDSSFNQFLSWAFGIFCAGVLPWVVLTSTRWIIFRAAEERLRAIPWSIWQPLYNRLLKLSIESLHRFSQTLPGHELYHAFNPERCNQQTLKVLVPYTEALTDQLVRPQSPVIWDNLPLAIRLPIYQRVSSRFKPCIDLLIINFETMLSELIDHKKFIESKLKQHETGYRFIPTEALHQYWHDVHSKSRGLSLFAVLLYLALGSIWPQITLHEILVIIPLIITLVTAWHTPPLKEKSREAFSRCIGFWLGERLYLIDDVIKHMASSDCDQTQTRRLISQAFRPLMEDAPLKTLAQLSLGRHALLDLRSGLVDYVMHNGSIPFEHSQFQHERALEVSASFAKSIETININEVNSNLAQIMKIVHQLFGVVALSTGFITILIVWYFTRM